MKRSQGSTKKVYVFPDTSKPHRCGILQHQVGIDMGTNLMNPQQQLFEEQAANIFAWGLQSTYTGYGMHELHEKKQHHWQTLPTILKRINPKLFEPSDAEHSGAEGNEGENENGDGDADVDDIFAETGGVNQAQLALQAPEVSGNVRRPKKQPYRRGASSEHLSHQETEEQLSKAADRALDSTGFNDGCTEAERTTAAAAVIDTSPLADFEMVLQQNEHGLY